MVSLYLCPGDFAYITRAHSTIYVLFNVGSYPQLDAAARFELTGQSRYVEP